MRRTSGSGPDRRPVRRGRPEPRRGRAQRAAGAWAWSRRARRRRPADSMDHDGDGQVTERVPQLRAATRPVRGRPVHRAHGEEGVRPSTTTERERGPPEHGGLRRHGISMTGGGDHPRGGAGPDRDGSISQEFTHAESVRTQARRRAAALAARAPSAAAPGPPGPLNSNHSGVACKRESHFGAPP